MARHTSSKLSQREQAILDCLQRHQEIYGYSPSIRELGVFAGIPSTSNVSYCLNKLERMGMIERDKKISRGIRFLRLAETIISPEMIVKVSDAVVKVPLLGRIAAGIPIELPASDTPYFDDYSALAIPGNLLPKHAARAQLFALEVLGDSMIDAMVAEGDKVILEAVDGVKNGDMVAAWFNQATTLKFFYSEKGQIRLQPANPAYQPIYVSAKDDILIQGRVVLIIRAY